MKSAANNENAANIFFSAFYAYYKYQEYCFNDTAAGHRKRNMPEYEEYFASLKEDK